MSIHALFRIVLWLAMGALALPAAAQRKDADCVKCHEDLTQRKVRHEALDFGCRKCHSTLDGSVKPHVSKGPVKMGLAAKGPELCFGCHEKDAFAKKVRHSAIRIGCTGCHDAHTSQHPKLLSEAPEELCYGCHEKKDYTGKSVHAPVKEGNCGGCHGAHVTDQANLLTETEAELCISCHAKVKKRPHAAAGFRRTGHPLGGETPGLADPLRPGREFSCVSCHEPHRSTQVALLRQGSGGGGFCEACHKK